MLRRALTGRAAALIVVAVAAAVIVAHPSGERKAPSDPAPSSVAAGLELEVGQDRSFALHLDSRVKVAGQAAVAGAAGQDMTLAVDGTLHLTVLRTAGDHATVLARVVAARLSFAQGGAPGAAAGLAPTIAGLGAGLAMTFGRDGVLRGFDQEPGLDRFADQLLRQAASSLQMALPAAGQTSAWDKQEHDGTGTYRGAYRVTSNDDRAWSLDKTKSGYTAMASEATGGGAPRVLGKVRGHFTSRVAHADGWPMEMAGDERIDVALGTPGSLSSTAVTHVRCTFEGRRLLDSQELAGLATRTATNTAPSRDPDDVRREQARKRLGQTTLSNVRDAYAHLDKVDARRRANAERALFDQTVAYVRVNDQALDELKASLSGRRASDPWLQNALGALAYVGCAKCQTTVVEQVMARTRDPNFANTLVPLLAEPRKPSLEGEQALHKLETSEDSATRSVAQLALGTVANKIAGSDDGRADRIVTDYVDQYRGASTTDGKLAALAVLGNTGAARLPAEIDALTRDPSDDVRAAAVQSLRLCPPDVATATLERMLVDPSPRVRAAVVDAFAQQSPNALAAELLSARLGVDASAGVRAAIVRALQSYYASSAAAKAAIDTAAVSDPDPAVRTLAKNTRVMFAAR